MVKNFCLGDVVEMKKGHPCGSKRLGDNKGRS